MTIFTDLEAQYNTAANWASGNPVLGANVMALETDTGRVKIGNGILAYNTLPYMDTPDPVLAARMMATLSAPLKTDWANRPAANAVSVGAQIRVVDTWTPPQGIVLVTDGTKWRPFGGSQLLAKMTSGSVTTQSLTTTLIEATPTFPAGLMVPGLSLDIRILYSLPAIGTAPRNVSITAGPPATGVINPVIFVNGSVVSGMIMNGSAHALLTCLTTNGPQRITPLFSTGIQTNVTQSDTSSSINFGAEWNLSFAGVSCAETAQTGVTATWAAGVATFTKTAHGYAVGDKIVTTTFTPTGYNGTLIVASVPTADTWTAAIVADPGGAGSGGTSSRISNVMLRDYSVMLVG